MPNYRKDETSMPRRDFLRKSVVTAGALGATSAAEAVPGSSLDGQVLAMADAPRGRGGRGASRRQLRTYNGPYAGEHNSRIAFPMGGMGAGMICLEGTGALSHVSLRNQPDVYNEPCVFAAVCVKGIGSDGGHVARVLEGQVPTWKLFGPPQTGNGAGNRAYGLPRFMDAEFQARFPFGMVRLSDPALPLDVEITGWSPFEPNDADHACLPVAGLEYTFKNRSKKAVEAVFSFNSKNFMPGNGQVVKAFPKGFIFFAPGAEDKPWERAAFCAAATDAATKVNCAWFRGGWFDSLTMAWKDVQEGACFDRPPISEGAASPGGSIFVPVNLAAGASRTVVLQLSWYSGQSNIRLGEDPDGGAQQDPSPAMQFYRPWYSSRFPGIEELAGYWRDHYDTLKANTRRFSDCFYDTTLPPEVVEAVAANLTILKSPTILRQADGKLWCWEGCCDGHGSCHGSCTHVWNYAQAIPHLFPALERTLRETEFEVNQNAEGRQVFRASLPIRPPVYRFHAATDGQLGGIMKAHREWRISGDTGWLRGIWPRVKQSLEYCIKTWDPKRKGYLEEPQHNTYDIEFWGPNGMLTSFYLGALAAAVAMAEAVGDEQHDYAALLEKGNRYAEAELFDGEYFIQKIQWEGLQAPDPTKVQTFGGGYSPEAVELLKKEGPKYQYGKGCLSDGVLGSWMAAVCGVGQVLDKDKIASHLKAVHRYNLKQDLAACGHANPQRPAYACGREGGLLLCSWPKGGALSLPFVYSNEVWTGIEYQVASHLMLMGLVDEGMEIVRVCRDRYDGRIRNPFNGYECGHWYARAMASYGLLQGLTGTWYDATTKRLHLRPTIKGDFRAFISTATGYGTVGVKKGKPFLEVKAGRIDAQEIDLKA